MARYSGRNGVVYVSPSGSTSATNVISLTSWSLDRSVDKLDVTSFGDSNKVQVIGLPDISGSFDGNWDDAQTQIFAAAASTDGCHVYLYPSSAAPTKYAGGPAWLDVSISSGVNDAVTISGTIAARGSWSIAL